MHSRIQTWNPAILQTSVASAIGCGLIGLVTLVNESNFRSAQNGDGGTDMQSLIKLGICGILGLFGLLNALSIKWSRLSPFSLLIVGFCGLAFACSATAINKFSAFASSCTLAGIVIFAYASLNVLGRERIVKYCLIFTTIFLLLCIVMQAVAPEINGFDSLSSSEASEARLAGLAHPNVTGHFAAFGLTLSLVAWQQKLLSRWFVVCCAILSMLTLLATGSRTWLIASVVMLAIFCWLSLPLLTSLQLGASLTVAILMVTLLAVSTLQSTHVDNGLKSLSRSGKSSEYYSMTGRVPLWLLCKKKFIESPIFGYGYGCQRFVLANHFWRTQHAHNIFINAALGTGVMGALILVGIYLRQTYLAIAQPCFFPDAMMVLILIGGMTENPILNPICGISTLFFIWALLWRESEAFSLGPLVTVEPTIERTATQS